jgi:oxaloacetate decarboxylase beta subunit
MATFFSDIFGNLMNIDLKMVIMWLIGGTLVYLAIAKEMEPSLLMPLGFGAILVNLPQSGVITQGDEVGAFDELFKAGIANELFPLLLFIGIGAMIDFGPLLSNPKLMLFGAAAQFGIFFTLSMSMLFGFELKDAASIGIIGAADGPSSIFVSQYLGSNYTGAIMVAAYSYMALVPVIQPPIMKALTTKEERSIVMKQLRKVSQREKILFPIIVTIVVGLIVPTAIPLVGMLMLGNLFKESGLTNRLSEVAQNALCNIVTIMLGTAVGSSAIAGTFLTLDTIKIIIMGVVAFAGGTAMGVLIAKLMNLFVKKENRVNPLIGSAGVSAVPMAARVSQVVGQRENPSNFLLMHALGPNVSGVIGSAVAAGVLIALFRV